MIFSLSYQTKSSHLWTDNRKWVSGTFIRLFADPKSTIILIPFIEKRVKKDSGHWLLFEIDSRNDTIYLFDPATSLREAAVF